MLPICIVCHASCEPPGYLCCYFDQRNIPYQKIHVNEQTLSAIRLEEVAGLIFMGGPHSVNDDHPWLAQEIDLIQRALEINKPMMGVCLGAQIISKALGAKVTLADHMETGWHEITLNTDAPEVAQQLPTRFEAFEWHEDTFEIPRGAVPVFRGRGIQNQGFAYGKVLAMQFHLEMTEHMVQEWLKRYKNCLPPASQTVQSPQQMTEHLSQRLDNLHDVADRIYDWWLARVYPAVLS